MFFEIDSVLLRCTNLLLIFKSIKKLGRLAGFRDKLH